MILWAQLASKHLQRLGASQRWHGAASHNRRCYLGLPVMKGGQCISDFSSAQRQRNHSAVPQTAGIQAGLNGRGQTGLPGTVPICLAHEEARAATDTRMVAHCLQPQMLCDGQQKTKLRH